MEKKNPGEIKNPINSLAGETSYNNQVFLLIPTFLHPQEDASCKPEIQFRAMESTKGE